MGKNFIKTGDRKTTVTREAVREAVNRSVKQGKTSAQPKAASAHVSKGTAGKEK